MELVIREAAGSCRMAAAPIGIYRQPLSLLDCKGDMSLRAMTHYVHGESDAGRVR
jgi:hypothetical protein